MSTYEPEVGDHVEVVLRGKVQRLAGGGFDIGPREGGNFIIPREPHVVSVKKVDPPKPLLPTTPGSVIRSRYEPRYLFARGVDKWIGLVNGARYRLTEFPPDAYDVIFDAGAES